VGLNSKTISTVVMATEQNALQDLLKKNKRIVQYRCNRGRVIHKGTPNSVVVAVRSVKTRVLLVVLSVAISV